MKSRCEKCKALLPSDESAYICSFECTFCSRCALQLQNACPNCGGELVLRPRRKRAVSPEPPAQMRTTAWSGIWSGRIWALSFGVWGFVSLAATVSIYALYHLRDNGMRFGTVAGMEFGEVLTYAPLTPLVYALAIRFPFQRSNWVRRSALYLAGSLVFTLGHIILAGATPYDYWDPVHREWSSAFWNPHTHSLRDPRAALKSMFFFHLVDDVTGEFVPIVIVAHAVAYYRRLRERERRAAQLEGQLAKARLQTLKSQMQPHFLFNTLHSISSLMLTDVVAADRMMTSLSDMLRMSLENNGTQVTSLSREVEFLNVYLDIERIRFEDRLHVALNIAPECLDAQVPHLLLQPLVENAIRHGVSKRSAQGNIWVVATRENDDLQLCVRDNGPGLIDSEEQQAPEEKARPGLGLSLTRERLRALYGEDQSCEIRNAAEGGAEVYLRMPFKTIPQSLRPEAMAVD